ncbi:MAG: methyltransferase, partial [Lachnospiraceae bacterium]|nr:methyltransferase [Lachnospiraceae bacterium]
TGTGVIPLLLAARHEGPVFTGLEIHPESADMARRSVLLNGLEERINIVTGDIKEADRLFSSGSFDVIVTNPPYMAGTDGLKNPSQAKAAARHELLCTIDDVLRVSAALLKSGGSFYMVHRPRRLAEIMEKMRKAHIEPKILRMIHPHAEDEAKMFLIKGTKDGGQWLNVERPLILFDENGERTKEVRELYGSE